MRLNSRVFLWGIFVLIAILGIYFVFAASGNLAPSTATAGQTISMLWFNVSNLSGGGVNLSGGNNLTSITINNSGTASGSNITNVTISNGTVYYNSSCCTFPVVIGIGNISGNTNFTINFTLNSSATWNKTIQANITAITSEVNVTFSPLIGGSNYNSTTVTINETTAPTATATCRDVRAGGSFPCNCSGTDSGATASGVASATGTSNAPEGTSTPSAIGTYTYTCTVRDNAGNSAGATAQYTVSTSDTGSATLTPTLPKNISSWTKITPGEVAIMKDFKPEIGIKEIQITVNNEAQNVKITVTKYNDKPADVSIAKSGKVYQYLQIAAENLETKLSKANVQFKVDKTWAASKDLNREKISVYKFDSASGKWNELATTASEDNAYYYYAADLNSFSYFTIAEKQLVSGEGTKTQTPTTGGTTEKGNNAWLWILVALALVFFVWRMMKKR